MFEIILALLNVLFFVKRYELYIFFFYRIFLVGLSHTSYLHLHPHVDQRYVRLNSRVNQIKVSRLGVFPSSCNGPGSCFFEHRNRVKRSLQPNSFLSSNDYARADSLRPLFASCIQNVPLFRSTTRYEIVDVSRDVDSDERNIVYMCALDKRYKRVYFFSFAF